jgi:hypothetical protein
MGPSGMPSARRAGARNRHDGDWILKVVYAPHGATVQESGCNAVYRERRPELFLEKYRRGWRRVCRIFPTRYVVCRTNIFLFRNHDYFHFIDLVISGVVLIYRAEALGGVAREVHHVDGLVVLGKALPDERTQHIVLFRGGTEKGADQAKSKVSSSAAVSARITSLGSS